MIALSLQEIIIIYVIIIIIIFFVIVIVIVAYLTFETHPCNAASSKMEENTMTHHITLSLYHFASVLQCPFLNVSLFTTFYKKFSFTICAGCRTHSYQVGDLFRSVVRPRYKGSQ